MQDGPGIRTTIFMKGCPLRCPWCHSPESQQFYPQISWMSIRCRGLDACGKCLPACSKGAITPGPTAIDPATQTEIRHIEINRAVCDNCGDCTAVCFQKALYLCGTDYTVDELANRVCKDKPFYDNSGGGVTISGGEPLYQLEFVLQLLKDLKKRGIHTALDTTGYAPGDSISAVLPYTDLFLFDLKMMDSERHQKATGVPNAPILENARKIASAGGKMQIRIPVIPKFNDSDENIRQTAVFCKSLDQAVSLVQLLPYHNLGVMKHRRIGERLVLEAQPPSDEKIAQIMELLESYGLAVTVH